MSKYVDIEPIIKDLTAMKSVYDAIALDGMIKALREAPTADVVEVVRCENCTLHDSCLIGARFKFAGITDGYCRIGKRKEVQK